MAVQRSTSGSGSIYGDGAASLSPPPSASAQAQSAAAQAAHQRTYQACIPCRRRKVRCDLGSVDNPSDPPCVRCRREAKECYFSATRRKKKGSAVDDSIVEPEVDYEIKSGRKRLRASIPLEQPEPAEAEDDETPRTPGGSFGRPQPLRRPTAPNPPQWGEEDQNKAEHTAALLQHREVHHAHDALKVLHDAALTLTRKNSKGERDQTQSVSGISPASLPPNVSNSPLIEKLGSNSYSTGPLAMYQNDSMWKTQIEGGNGVQSAGSIGLEATAYAKAVKAWTRFRFVRAGWFTAKEAMDYVEYFYKNLSPLSPICLPDYRSYAHHETLLTQEPMLTVTMLLIASRHAPLEGPGALSRPYSIHQKLWGYLSGMINRVVWGQEQFGGGFCGAGSEPGSDVHPLMRKGLRTLGTVESLLLLTEWHPRAMHFPPDEADDELMVPDEPSHTPDLTGEESSGASKGIGGQRMDAWLEPCWRSDRMCWMLLGMAMSLAFEIGVFDASELQRHARAMDAQQISAEHIRAYDRRRASVRDLLLIYVTQTSGRLGLTTMLPGNYSKPEDSVLYKSQIGQHESIQETVLHFWLRMASLMREGNQKIFANKAFTRDLIRNGNYRAALDGMKPALREWKIDFDKCAAIPKYMRAVLDIEYEYCRVYINALALQAIAERCANEHPLQVLDPPSELARAAAANGKVDVAIAPQTLAKWLGGDRHYMVEVGEASRNLLKIVVNDLFPGEYLRHAPVRTYFRIISVAIMLLKSFSLGASESDVADSLSLMDRTVEALRGCIVDDVHVASRFADLLDTLTQSLKPRLVRISADGRHGKSRRVSCVGIDPEATPGARTVAALGKDHTLTSGGAAAHPTAAQWSGINGSHHPANVHSAAYNQAMYGVSNDAYDLMAANNKYSIMPPPSFGFPSPTAQRNTNASVTPGSTNGYDPYGNFNGEEPQDWLALPLDPLINMSGADVHNTMYGPELGGQDMLELLFSGGGGPGAPSNGGGSTANAFH